MHYKKARKTGERLIIFVCFYFFIVLKSFSLSLPLDSLGIEKQGNKTFILHQVDPKETLFSLSRRYNVKVDLIEIENPEVKAGLKVGQILRIPYQPKNQPGTSNSNSTTFTPPKPSSDKSNKTHVVEQGQTLYSISRQFNVSVDEIKKWNNLPSNELNVGQEIFVSTPQNSPKKDELHKENSETESKPVEQPKNVPNFRYDSKGNKVHTAEPGQTLFSISQIYNTSLDDIKKWNGLSVNEIATGQEIIVEKVKEKIIEPPKEKVTDTPIKNNNSSVPQNNVSSTKPAEEQPKIEERQPEPISKPSNNNLSGFNKVVERGLAEVIESSEETPKFLALHKTANVGTIIQVKNELNNLYIFARVIGRLPQTGSNDKLVIKLSKKAYDKLGAIDKRFPVVISYVPNN